MRELKENGILKKTTASKAKPAPTRAQSGVETRKIGSLVPDSRNANKCTERGQQMIENSLRKFGAGRSIVLDKHGVIIAGNKTVENAGAIGLEDIIVVRTDGTKLVAVQRMDLDLAKDELAKGLAIADNRAGQVSLEWDPEVLTGLAGQLDMGQFFTAEEFAKLTGAPLGNELVGDEDDAPELPQEATTREGDLYVMGSHRLVCGDATKEGTYQRLMDGYQADLVVTDPPYNIDYTGKTKKTLKIENDSKTDEDFFAFILAAYGACSR